MTPRVVAIGCYTGAFLLTLVFGLIGTNVVPNVVYLGLLAGAVTFVNACLVAAGTVMSDASGSEEGQKIGF